MRSRWIDGARGLAILMVMAVHVAQRSTGAPAWFETVTNFGAMGVQLFFVLSGYCACLANERHVSTNRSLGMERVFLSRYKRLAPPYIIAMGLYALLFRWGFGSANWHQRTLMDVFSNLTLLNTFVPSGQNTMVPGGWSISCIAVFAFAFLWIDKTMQSYFAIKSVVATALSIAVSATLYYAVGLPKQFCYMLITTHICCFLVGMGYYKWHGKHSSEGTQFFSDTLVIACSSIILVFAAFLVSFFHCAFLFRALIVSLGFVGWLILLERHETLIPSVLIDMGRRSYWLFVLHFAVIFTLCPMIVNGMPSANWSVRYVVGYVCVVTVSYFFASLATFVESMWCNRGLYGHKVS